MNMLLYNWKEDNSILFSSQIIVMQHLCRMHGRAGLPLDSEIFRVECLIKLFREIRMVLHYFMNLTGESVHLLLWFQYFTTCLLYFSVQFTQLRSYIDTVFPFTYSTFSMRQLVLFFKDKNVPQNSCCRSIFRICVFNV